MFKSILNFLKELLQPLSTYHELDVYIAAHHPTCVGDVEKLERDFYRTRESFSFRE